MRKQTPQTDFDIAAAALGSIADNSADFEALFRDEPKPIHRQHGPADLRDSYEMIPHSQIEVWDANPGKGIRTREVQELQSDILSNRANGGGIAGSGIEQPLTVRPIGDDKYVLLYGERRYNATDGTAVTELPCIVRRNLNENEALEQSIREDLHQKEWTPIQAGQALIKYMAGENHHNAPRSLPQTAKDFGVSKGFIDNRVRTAKAPPELQAMVEERPNSMSHIEYLIQVENPRKQKELIRQVLSGAPVTRIKEQVNEITKKHTPPSHAPAPSLPPRPAFDGITKAGEYNPAQSTLTSRTIVVNEAAPDYTAMAQQAAQLWQRVAEQAEYSDVSEAVQSTLSAIAKLKKRA